MAPALQAVRQAAIPNSLPLIVPPPLTRTCRTRRSPLQGFDKYGEGAFDAIPTPHLQKALGLKAGGRVQLSCAVSSNVSRASAATADACCARKPAAHGGAGVCCMLPCSRTWQCVRCLVCEHGCVPHHAGVRDQRATRWTMPPSTWLVVTVGLLHHSLCAGVVTSGNSLDYTAKDMACCNCHVVALLVCRRGDQRQLPGLYRQGHGLL